MSASQAEDSATHAAAVRAGEIDPATGQPFVLPPGQAEADHLTAERERNAAGQPPTV